MEFKLQGKIIVSITEEQQSGAGSAMEVNWKCNGGELEMQKGDLEVQRMGAKSATEVNWKCNLCDLELGSVTEVIWKCNGGELEVQRR